MDVIVTHNNADFDALGSLVAASKLYPNAKVIHPSSKERSVRDFLSMVHEGIRAENEKNVDFKKMSRLIMVDTRLKSRIGKAAEFLKNSGLQVHCYDHHPRGKNDLIAHKDVYRRRGATVTILLEIIKKKKIPISPLEATIFALGIYEDTGSLTFQTTTKKDIDMVSYLFSQRANLSLIASCLSRELSKAEMHLLSQLIDATKIFRVAGVNIAISSVRIHDESQDLAWVTHKLLEIENFSVLFTLVNIGERIQMIARSRLNSVDVNKIIRKFNGGGHPSAASATIRGKRISEVEKELLGILKKRVKSKLNAADIMNVDLNTFNLKVPVYKAKKILSKLRLDAAAVVENGKFEGIITRSDIDRALAQGFAHAPIKGYMRKKVPAVSADAPLEDVQRSMSEERLDLLPVLENGKLIGVVSQRDILKSNYKDVFIDRVQRKEIKTAEHKQLDLGKKMERVLPKKTISFLKKIGRIADQQKINAYIIGGFVRDLIQGRANLDMDIVVEANAIEFAQILAKRFKAEVEIHQRFKTAKIKLKDGTMLDIATARTEFYEYPAALPVVKSSSLAQDLCRRDFTINTLAIGLNKKTFAKLIDFFNGGKDIREKRIRVLHDLSFVEDPTRILRAIRFEQRFDFLIDKHTENLIQAAVDLEMFDRLHKIRIADELILLLSEPHPIKVIRRMAHLHELKFIHRRLKFNKKMLQNLESVEEILGWYKLSFFQLPLRRQIVYLLVILDDLTEKEAQEVFKKFSFKKSVKECVFVSKENELNIFQTINKNAHVAPSGLYKLFKPLPLEVLLFFMAKTKTMKKKEFYINFLRKYANIKLKISGHDLKKIVSYTGPRFKQALALTLCAKIDGIISTKKEELEFARKILCA
ncbi:MAG: CBS domain-containing protein [Candidatus Omnitrophica bacterium]|nr:CBS domain-containing protein [Candidatus Omnitrophota bacterium]